MNNTRKSIATTLWGICVGIGMVIVAWVALSFIRQLPIAGSTLIILLIIGLSMIVIPLLGGILATQINPEMLDSDVGKKANLFARSNRLFAPPLTGASETKEQNYKKEHLRQ